MKIAVYYYSKGGSTKKLAEAVAEAAGVKARTVDEPLEGPYELMFIGGALMSLRKSTRICVIL